MHQRQAFHDFGHARKVADDAGKHVGCPAPLGECDPDCAQKAVGNQQGAEQKDFFLEPESVDGEDRKQTCNHPEGAADITLAGKRADRLRWRIDLSACKGRLLVRTVFLRRDDGPHDRREERKAAAPEAQLNRIRDTSVRRHVADAGLFEKPGEDRSHHGTCADEGCLHRIAGGVLIGMQHVADKGAEGLHRDVERRIEHPEHCCGE